MKNLTLLILVFILVPLYLFAEDIPPSQEETPVSKIDIGEQLQKNDEKITHNKADVTIPSTNEIIKSNNEKLKNIEISQVASGEDEVANEQNDSNIRVGFGGRLLIYK